ncbi:craniofacial development protein 1-like [Paramacrobiotus metropolitanus]|uniref:craniofacial development protein 1-like n=1 Tax=Paramacrobiotus metropolitanus TaxID=2943436 RepID=UPI002445B027|nr:craniofacial development protein 1-like [Paramacrobiotus metropolitanus]
MALQYRRNADEDSTDESDDDYVPPEHVEVEEEGSESGEADLEPSSGGDTDLDVGKRKRKRKIRVKANSRGKKKSKYGDDLDNNDNDETTSNETLVCMPKKPASATTVHSFNAPASGVSSDNVYSSSTPSPNPNDSSSNRGSAVDDKNGSGRVSSTSRDSTTSAVAPSPSQNASSSKAPSGPVTGLGSVLAKLSGKKKMSTLDKSQLDWKKYKNDHGLDEDLAQFNKGKGGYLDRKEFLERANLREYEYDQNVKSSGSRRSTM